MFFVFFSFLQDHAQRILNPAAVGADIDPQSLTAAMLTAGAIGVLEPGFAELLDIVPPLDGSSPNAGQMTVAGAGKGVAEEESAGARRAVISRWEAFAER